MAEFFDSSLMILCIIGSYANFHYLLFKNASILGLVLLNLSYIMLSFSGRNQRASWREFLVTLKMMWSPPTLWAIAGINYVNIIVAFFQLITWHYSFFCFPKGLLTIFLIIVPDQVFLMQRLELHWIRTLWSLFLGTTTSGDTGKCTFNNFLYVIVG